jgi:streptogramin lyase
MSSQPQTKAVHREAILAFLLAGIAAAGCSSAPATWSVEDVGTARGEINLAPGNAQCAVIKVVGTKTVTKQIDLEPAATTVFELTGLPLGMDVFTANVYAQTCAQLGTSPAPTWVSDPVTANVTTSSPVSITFKMVPAGQGGTANVGLDFPAPNTVAEFALPDGANSQPNFIALGPDGNMWVTEFGAQSIARVTPAGVVTEVSIGESSAQGITAGPDGNLWFADANGAGIGRLALDGTVHMFQLPSGSGTPNGGIAVGPDGNLWFTMDFVVGVGRITPEGTVTVFPVPTANSRPFGIAVGTDGALWFTESTANKIGRITTSGAITEKVVPSQPTWITSGPDGALWYTSVVNGTIGRITPAGAVTEFPAGTRPFGIVTGPDGNLWFADWTGDAVGRITPSGAVKEFAVPTPGALPVGIAVGTDGNLWFVENGSGKVGRIAPQ